MSKDVAYSSVSKADGDEDLIEAVVLPESPVAATGRKEFAQLRAPSTLPGGYELTVELDGAHWVVLVVRSLHDDSCG